jgi:hypothetical protein
MKRSHKIAVGIVGSLGLVLAVAAAHAHPGFMGGGMGPGMMHGMGPGFAGGFRGPMGAAGFAGPAAAQQLMTPEERTALIEKMRNAKTPEERQKLAEATHAEMEKRAKEKGITLPAPGTPGAGLGPNFAPPFAAPAK